MKLNEEDKKFLELYSDSEYEKPSVTVDCVIFRLVDIPSSNYRKLPEKKLQVCLLKRKYSPFKDLYSIPGTFIDLNFELNDSAKLCVHKKVGLENFYYEQLFTFGEKSRDPRTRVLSTSYLFLTNQEQKTENGEWFNLDLKTIQGKNKVLTNGYEISKLIEIKLSNENNTLKSQIQINIKKENLIETKSINIVSTDLAFDHAKIIFFAFERLKNKLEYTDIIFNLLPKKFTLTGLKMAYDTILGTKLLDANFRRKTSKLVSPLNEFESGKGFRNSQLFTHNPNWNITNLD